MVKLLMGQVFNTWSGRGLFEETRAALRCLALRIGGLTMNPNICEELKQCEAMLYQFLTYKLVSDLQVSFTCAANKDTGKLFKMMAGANLVHMPYRRPAPTDLLGGQTDLFFWRDGLFG